MGKLNIVGLGGAIPIFKSYFRQAQEKRHRNVFWMAEIEQKLKIGKMSNSP